MRSILAFGAMMLNTLVYGTMVVVPVTFGYRPKPNGLLESAPRRFSRGTLRAAGVRLTVTGAENIREGQSAVYIANHVSWFDIFALASFLPRYRFIAKAELRKIPIFGAAADAVAAIYIDRKNHRSALDTYASAADQVQSGMSIVIYPEGTRGHTYELRPFKKGPFVLAISAQIPIVPCVILGSREVQGKGSARVRAHPVEVVVLEPIPTAGMTYADRDALLQTAWDRMAAVLRDRYGVESGGRAMEVGATGG